MSIANSSSRTVHICITAINAKYWLREIARNAVMRMNGFDGSAYNITTKLGEGSFGEVFQGVWQGEDVAVKVERRTAHCPQLAHEFKLLQKLQAGVGIPFVHALETSGGCNVMVMELLGPTIHDVFISCGKSFDAGLVLRLGVQMLSRLEFVHSRGVVHRDMKPDNFLIGRGIHSHMVYLIDYGIAQYFRDPKSLKHVSLTYNHSLRGTAKYCSLNTHRGLEQSRRDDLESLGYVLLYLALGSLPWENFKSPLKSERHQGIGSIKENTSLASLCQPLPAEFEQYISYCRALMFDARPDYKYLKKMMKDAAERLDPAWDGLTLKLPIEWETRARQESAQESELTESEC